MPWDCHLGSPHALGVWKRPQKEEPPSGLGVGRVWSCLVRSTSLYFESSFVASKQLWSLLPALHIKLVPVVT